MMLSQWWQEQEGCLLNKYAMSMRCAALWGRWMSYIHFWYFENFLSQQILMYNSSSYTTFMKHWKLRRGDLGHSIYHTVKAFWDDNRIRIYAFWWHFFCLVIEDRQVWGHHKLESSLRLRARNTRLCASLLSHLWRYPNSERALKNLCLKIDTTHTTHHAWIRSMRDEPTMHEPCSPHPIHDHLTNRPLPMNKS